jgi:hydrogenase large subunit
MTLRFPPILPIQYDEQGIGRFRIDPVTRTAGQLTLEATVDLLNRRVVEARVERRSAWRPERIVIDRPPSDSVWLMSRFRGSGSVAHAIAAVMALETAYQTSPPPLAIATRGLGAAAELVAAHTRQLFQIAGPDYSEAAISRTNIGLWRSAQEARASGHVFHGHRTIADIMRSMNPFGGHLYRESLHLTRVACEIVTLLFGKYPHPSALFPAGIGIVADADVYQQVLGRFNRLLDYSKKVTAVWDDLVTFFQQSVEPFERSGESAHSLVSFGLWDDPEAGDNRPDRAGQPSYRRYSTPGVVVGRQLVATDLPSIERRLAEQGRPGFESGPIARLWITAVSGQFRNEFIECQRRGGIPNLLFDLPAFQAPATFLAWQLPERINALERNRARAYQVAYASLIALTYLLRSFETLAKGQKAMSNRYQVPSVATGIGLWEEPSGAVIHQISIEERRISNYRVSTPDTWLQSGSDGPRRLGVIEQELINTPLVEEFSRPETFTGIDLLRVIRSFDC